LKKGPQIAQGSNNNWTWGILNWLLESKYLLTSALYTIINCFFLITGVYIPTGATKCSTIFN